MKRMTVFAMLIMGLLFMSGCASNGMNGAMGGAAGGALLGQMIGHNTESTLIGTAVGTMFGYIAGNEYDKFNQNYRVIPRQQQSYYRQPVQYRQAPRRQYRRQTLPPQQWQPGW